MTGGTDGNKIRAMKTEYTKPLSLRSVYMMNCVGSSLNQAWLDAGGRTACGTVGNNYLPEPTMYFFWQNWKDGQTFEASATSAYRKTVNLMKDAVQGFLSALPGGGLLAALIDFENLDFVKSSAPLVVGQRTITMSSDSFDFSQSVASSLATTVLPMSLLRSLSDPDAGTASAVKTPLALSQNGMDLIKGFEAFIAKPYNAPEGNCTVGYGSVIHQGKCDGRSSEQPYADGIGEQKATQMLADAAAGAAKTINNKVSVTLNQNQFDALVSFTYNVGDAAFSGSTLLKKLNGGDYDSVPGEMKKWTKATVNGKVVELAGLVKRRASEAELFEKPMGATSQSTAMFPARHSYVYERESSVVFASSTYSRAQNPAAAVIAGIEVADAAQIGLGTIAVVQAQVASSQGSFSLSYDKAQRMLTTEARMQMPGAQSAKQGYSRKLLYVGNSAPNQAYANVIIEWEGNAYGEIGTAVMRRDLSTSSEWSKSSCNTTITKVDRIPLPKTDPRTWPIVYTYEGTYDPAGNGYFEFSGEFEINAFGGLRFNRHQVMSRSLLDFAIRGSPDQYVVRGEAFVPPIPEIPKEQLD